MEKETYRVEVVWHLTNTVAKVIATKLSSKHANRKMQSENSGLDRTIAFVRKVKE